MNNIPNEIVKEMCEYANELMPAKTVTERVDMSVFEANGLIIKSAKCGYLLHQSEQQKSVDWERLELDFFKWLLPNNESLSHYQEIFKYFKEHIQGAKTTLLLLIAIFCTIPVFARESPDSFTCFSDRLVKVAPAGEKVESPWEDHYILVAFNYDKGQINIYARQTLTLHIKSVGAHYETKEGDNAVDMVAVDHRGLRCVVSFVMCMEHGLDKKVGRREVLIVRYKEVEVVYKLRRVDCCPGIVHN